jgi:hypothetical protein
MDPVEASEIAQVERRLIAELSPAVRPEEVQRCVRDVVAQFGAAKIRRYVPLLVERITRDQLQAAVLRDTDRPRPTSSTSGARDPRANLR